MSVNSSKIPLLISQINFDGKYTSIKYYQNYTPSGQQEAVTEEYEFTSDNQRHNDFTRAMERLMPHMLLRTLAFIEFKDRLGKDIDKVWFDEFLFADDPRFQDTVLNNVVITTKKDITGFKLSGTINTIDDQILPFKGAVISTLKMTEGYNYPLMEIFKSQVETLIEEAKEFMKGKNGNPQLKLAV